MKIITFGKRQITYVVARADALATPVLTPGARQVLLLLPLSLRGLLDYCGGIVTVIV